MKLSANSNHNDTNSYVNVKRNRNNEDDVYAYSNYHQCNTIDDGQCVMMMENKIYENTDMPFLFFSGTSRFEFKTHYFNFPFRFSHTHVESKENVSINILAMYNDNKELYVSFQIGDEDSFPKTKDKFNTLDNVVDKNITNVNCTNKSVHANTGSFEYKVSIFASLISFTTIQYDFEVSKGDNKWMRVPFKDTFINNAQQRSSNNENDNNNNNSKPLVLICEISIIKNQNYLTNKLKPPFSFKLLSSSRILFAI